MQIHAPDPPPTPPRPPFPESVWLHETYGSIEIKSVNVKELCSVFHCVLIDFPVGMLQMHAPDPPPTPPQPPFPESASLHETYCSIEIRTFDVKELCSVFH